jgi:hypothetical protein
MRAGPSRARRPSFVRHAAVATLFAFATYVGCTTSCDDRLPGIVLLPAEAVQALIGIVSFGWAIVTWCRGDRRGALAELGDGVLVLLSIPASGLAFAWALDRSCS